MLAIVGTFRSLYKWERVTFETDRDQSLRSPTCFSNCCWPRWVVEEAEGERRCVARLDCEVVCVRSFKGWKGDEANHEGNANSAWLCVYRCCGHGESRAWDTSAIESLKRGRTSSKTHHRRTHTLQQHDQHRQSIP